MRVLLRVQLCCAGRAQAHLLLVCRVSGWAHCALNAIAAVLPAKPLAAARSSFGSHQDQSSLTRAGTEFYESQDKATVSGGRVDSWDMGTADASSASIERLSKSEHCRKGSAAKVAAVHWRNGTAIQGRRFASTRAPDLVSRQQSRTRHR